MLFAQSKMFKTHTFPMQYQVIYAPTTSFIFIRLIMKLLNQFWIGRDIIAQVYMTHVTWLSELSEITKKVTSLFMYIHHIFLLAQGHKKGYLNSLADIKRDNHHYIIMLLGRSQIVFNGMSMQWFSETNSVAVILCRCLIR